MMSSTPMGAVTLSRTRSEGEEVEGVDPEPGPRG